MLKDFDPAPHRGPLAGLRVLDLTSVLMGPYCTQILADLGAEVTKLESPEGDSSRLVGPALTRGAPGSFRNLNRGKKCIAVDLARPEGRELCLMLAARSDVFIHSIRPQAISKLGLDYSAVSGANPSIIYCNLYGYGRGGRYAGTAAYDDTIQAASGLAMLQGELSGSPQYVATVLADKVGALTGAYAILAALHHRNQTEEGQEIDVPMFESMVSFLMVEHLTGAMFDPPLSRPTYERLTTPNRRPYPTRDGYIATLIYTDKQWQRFTEIAERPDLMVDTRFATLTDRIRNADSCYALIGRVLKERSTNEWLSQFNQAGIPAQRVNRTDDLFEDPHLKDVNFFQEIQDPKDGRLRMPGHPVHFSRTPAKFNTAGPLFGQNTRDVLLAASLSVEEIDALDASGVIVDGSGKETR